MSSLRLRFVLFLILYGVSRVGLDYCYGGEFMKHPVECGALIRIRTDIIVIREGRDIEIAIRCVGPLIKLYCPKILVN
jgi:hypothetical protein